MLQAASRMCLLHSVVALSLLSAVSLGVHHGPPSCKHWKTSCVKHQMRSCCQPLQSEEYDADLYPSGLYTLRSGSFITYDAWCDMETDDGGWTTIMRRTSADVNFKRLYHEYEDGFGDLEGDFWYGLKAMKTLTSSDDYEMRLDLFDEVNDTVSSAYATYSSFQVEGDNYTLRLSGFEGSHSSLSDNLMQFNEQKFVAQEHRWQIIECVEIKQAGWWYVPEYCVAANKKSPGSILTEPFNALTYYDPNSGTSNYREYAKWEMKIRPLNCMDTTSTQTLS